MSRPPVWAIVLVGTAILATAFLAVWQWQRADGKRALLASYASALAQEPRLLSAASTVGVEPVRAHVRGHYDASRQLLLDNQSHAGKPGYQVWTPLLAPDGTVVMVNRGWVPASPDRRVLPDLSVPARPLTARGLWRALPQPALRLEKTENCPAALNFPAVVTYPDEIELRCLMGGRVLAGVLLLDADLPDGYVREWQTSFVGVPPSRHTAYAAQWAALSLTLLILFVRAYRK